MTKTCSLLFQKCFDFKRATKPFLRCLLTISYVSKKKKPIKMLSKIKTVNDSGKNVNSRYCLCISVSYIVP